MIDARELLTNQFYETTVLDLALLMADGGEQEVVKSLEGMGQEVLDQMRLAFARVFAYAFILQGREPDPSMVSLGKALFEQPN